MNQMKKILTNLIPFFLKMGSMLVFAMILFGMLAGTVVLITGKQAEQVKVKQLNKHYNSMANILRDSTGKARVTTQKSSDKKIYVLDFVGDVAASALDNLRKEISVILQTATAEDEIILRLNSGGGFVHTYGLASSQLQRIKDAGIPLTITVDKVAASGGYMMACMADTLIAAPFSIVGSIGVVTEYPNFSGWMEKHGITYEQHTAGKYKRTVSPFTPPTKEAEAKMKTDLARVHTLFKDLVTSQRKEVEIEKIATGDIWFGSEALQKKLIDRVSTSDDVIMERIKTANVYQISYTPEMKFSETLAVSASTVLEKLFLKVSGAYLNNW